LTFTKISMKYLPIGLDLRGQICIVVGGGIVGARKALTLLEAGGTVTVVSPAGTDQIKDLAESGAIRWERRPFSEEDMENAFLVVVATDQGEVNDLVVLKAQEAGVLFCDATAADRTQITFGALHRGKDVTVAVFTDGENPRRARNTRDRIAGMEEKWGED
jgi:siroheme synthase-like protein